jgi:hypothetical protein
MSSVRRKRFSKGPGAAIGSACLLTAILAFSAASPAHAAGPKRCDWHGPLSGGEHPYAKCVDFAALEGKTLTLPKNVTRIAADGISFCVTASPITGNGNADIVFVYDNSGSMTADAFYVAPGGDTSFYYLETDRNGNYTGCGKNPSAGMVNVATVTGNQLMSKLTSNNNCTGFAGDPYNARGSIVMAGIDFLASKSPTSTAGAMAFNDKVEYTQAPVIMSGTGPATVKASIKLDTNGSTEYRPPLIQADAWLSNPALIKTKKQAIIFISDGASNHDDYDNLVAGLPPVYSIYLSDDDTPNMIKLRDLSTATGGTFNRVKTNDPKAMETILKEIISTITTNTLPKSTTITNKTQAPPQVSKSTGVTANPDGSAGMQLDSIIGLKEGANQIEINLVREDNTEVTYHFTMNVAGDDISSSSGNYSCWDMPTLAAIDKKTNEPTDIYRTDNNTYQLKLTRSPSELGAVNVAGTSADKDKENITLSTTNNNLGFPTQTGDFTYNPAKGNPDLNNGVLEVDDHGDLIFTWSHPRDARETVTYTLPGRIVPVISGDPTLKIQHPVTEGVTFDPATVVGPNGNTVVILDQKDKCVVNCSGTQVFHVDGGAPTWNLTVKSPIRYEIKVFDNLGQFVSNSEGEMNAAAWTALAKTGDSAVVHLKILPVSKDGQQLGTGAYLMMATITALGDQVTKGSTGETIVVKNAQREYLRKFGYVRR